MLEDESEIQ